MSLKYNFCVIDKTNITSQVYRPILELFYTLNENNICMEGQLGFDYINSRLNFLLPDKVIDDNNTREIVTNFIQYDEHSNNKLFIYIGYNSEDKTKGILSFAFISEYQNIVEVVLLCKQDSVPDLTDYAETVRVRKLENKKTASAALITYILNTYGKNNKTVMLQPSSLLKVFEWYLQFNPTYFNIVGTESIDIDFMIWFPELNKKYIHDMLVYITEYVSGGEVGLEESDVNELTDIILKRIDEMTEFKTICTSTSDKECNMRFIDKKVEERGPLGGRKYKNLKQIKKTYNKNKKNKKKLKKTKKTKKTKKIKYTFRK